MILKNLQEKVALQAYEETEFLLRSAVTLDITKRPTSTIEIPKAKITTFNDIVSDHVIASDAKSVYDPSDNITLQEAIRIDVAGELVGIYSDVVDGSKMYLLGKSKVPQGLRDPQFFITRITQLVKQQPLQQPAQKTKTTPAATSPVRTKNPGMDEISRPGISDPKKVLSPRVDRIVENSTSGIFQSNTHPLINIIIYDPQEGNFQPIAVKTYLLTKKERSKTNFENNNRQNMAIVIPEKDDTQFSTMLEFYQGSPKNSLSRSNQLETYLTNLADGKVYQDQNGILFEFTDPEVSLKGSLITAQQIYTELRKHFGSTI